MDIHELDSCTSTNDLALAATEGKNGETWIAFEQTQGRGRRHQGSRRAWFSPADSGVYFSILLRPDCKPADISGLTLIVGAALCESLRALGVNAWLKWPNDIYVGTQKLAGILTEASTSKGMLDQVVIGVGINVNLHISDIPEDLLGTMTSMSMEKNGEKLDRLEIALGARTLILEKSETFFREGFSTLFDYLVQFDESRGIEVETHKGRGKVIGIAKSGALEVENQKGRFYVNAGEVKFLFQKVTNLSTR